MFSEMVDNSTRKSEIENWILAVKTERQELDR